MIRVDGTWTSRGRAGAAEIAWQEARDGGARSKGMIRVDGTWTSRGRAGAAEIAWEDVWDVVAGVLLYRWSMQKR